MDKKQTEGGQGRLPAMAPLANPYVPFQLENAPKYEARKGLVRGTLFPGLDLPFMGMVNQTEKPVTPLSELQALSFAVQELALYLDTHRMTRRRWRYTAAISKCCSTAVRVPEKVRPSESRSNRGFGSIHLAG